MTAALMALWLAAPMLEVTGDSTCPTPEEVRDRLAGLTPSTQESAADDAAAHRAVLSSRHQSVHIELLGSDGGLLAERNLDNAGACGELAEAVAVVLSTWQAKFNPNLATPTVSPPLRLPDKSAATNVEKTKPRSKRRMPFDVGMALLASIVGGDTAFGAKLEGCLFPINIPLGVDVVLSAASTHSQSIKELDGAAQWWRVALSAGPSYRIGRGLAILDLHTGGVLALLHVQGTALWRNTSDTRAQLGVEAGMRSMWTWNNGAGWIGTDLFAYPGQDRLTIGNYGDVGKLPHLEVQIALGISLGRFH